MDYTTTRDNATVYCRKEEDSLSLDDALIGFFKYTAYFKARVSTVIPKSEKGLTAIEKQTTPKGRIGVKYGSPFGPYIAIDEPVAEKDNLPGSVTLRVFGGPKESILASDLSAHKRNELLETAEPRLTEEELQVARTLVRYKGAVAAILMIAECENVTIEKLVEEAIPTEDIIGFLGELKSNDLIKYSKGVFSLTEYGIEIANKILSSI